MIIKEQAYRAHAFLRARGVTSLKRSYIHELLAAAVGYSTYAAFQFDATWCELPFSLTGIKPDDGALEARCAALGIPADEGRLIVDALPKFQLEAGHALIRFDALIDAFDWDGGGTDASEWVWAHIVEPAHAGVAFYFEHHRELLYGLEAAARRGVPAAHLAIAKLLESEVALFGDEEERLRSQVKREGTWTSPFVGFAEIETSLLRLEHKHRHHLLAAARSGDIRALMETAERYGDPAILELTPSPTMDPMRLVAVAAEHGDDERVRYWLTIAAQEGDIGAMRELILDHGEPADQAWVWMYLSRLLGRDLSQDRFEAINEDSTLYDDDIGGPAYVGGDEGIYLDPLPANADRSARQTATQFFARINALRDCI
ncbi:hypothetical protein [Lysobacter niastensis]|uniref:SMI1/KNR4 family protein n=1 Tax=Lysobacter niastensis TaxID=380629 RepID=A0ABS0B3E1_9GAMM|nr:hypothetical protein [Lysobacter niastensis]MBF6022985.1 hypothetical protein [Lysobacter niastensis]